jgi:hypothetical protein
LLLETAPGMKFREIYTDLDLTAARSYFEDLVRENTMRPRVTAEALLGPDYGRYKRLLQLIDPEELRIGESIEGGQGAFAKAYKAIWEDGDNPKHVAIKVVLKGNGGKGDEHAHRKFIKEVCIHSFSYSLPFTPLSAGCYLFGFDRTPGRASQALWDKPAKARYELEAHVPFKSGGAGASSV